MWRTPVAGHRLATVEAPILFRGPIALIAPCLIVSLRASCRKPLPRFLEVGAGLIEGGGGTVGLLARPGAGIETAKTDPTFSGSRYADRAADTPDMHIAEIDQPAIGAGADQGGE